MATQQGGLAHQYGTSANLDARIALHTRFSANPYGWNRWVFDQLNLPVNCRVLEVGCGTGALWQGNRQRIPVGWRLVLTDASDGMVQATHANTAGLPQVEQVLQAGAQALPFDDDAFDAVIANHMLYHVPVLDDALAELHRVLKPGGKLFATTLGDRHMQEYFDLLEPFADELPARMDRNQVRDQFSLQNGSETLGRWFADIRMRRYEDALLVTDVDLLVAYVQSIAYSDQPVLSGDRLTQFRRTVEIEIAEKGYFYITKDSGIFRAKKHL